MYEQGSRRTPEEVQMLRIHSSNFSRIGFALLIQMGALLAVQTLAIMAAGFLAPELLRKPVFLWVVTVVSAYGTGLPLYCMVIRPVPASPSPVIRTPMQPARFLKVYLAAMSAMYLTNFATLMLMKLIELIRGVPIPNPVDSLASYPVLLNLLLTCVAAPVVEEITFRGMLLRRFLPYGEKFAVLASALCFGLFHGNLYQMFYAIVLGILFGYVVVRTGCVWQTILLHAMINFVGGVLMPASDQFDDAGKLLVSGMLLLFLSAGTWFLLQIVRAASFNRSGPDWPERLKWRLFIENPGMILFFALVALEVVGFLL